MKQNISKYASRTVGEIVADNYAAADVFHHFGVDSVVTALTTIWRRSARPMPILSVWLPHLMACMRSRERPPILSNGRRIY